MTSSCSSGLWEFRVAHRSHRPRPPAKPTQHAARLCIPPSRSIIEGGWTLIPVARTASGMRTIVPLRLILSRNELLMPLHRLLHRLIRHPLGLPLFEIFIVGLILLTLLISILLPLISWIRSLLS